MKRKKIICGFCIFFAAIILACNTVNADILGDITDSVTNMIVGSPIEDPINNPDVFQPGSMSGADKVMDVGNRIIGIIRFVGSFASVIVLIVIGIKYMTGSLEERAEYKKTMVPYLIGAILVFAITNILGIVDTITGGLF